MLHSTHTFAVMEVSKSTFNEIAKKLREANYYHAFVGDCLDMHGIGLRLKTSPKTVKLKHPKAPPNELVQRGTSRVKDKK